MTALFDEDAFYLDICEVRDADDNIIGLQMYRRYEDGTMEKSGPMYRDCPEVRAEIAAVLAEHDEGR